MFCAVREENMDAQYNRLEAKWGQAAHFTEHEISDLVRYSIEGQVRTGTIIWTCAPTQGQSLRYVIQHEGANEQPDIVCPGRLSLMTHNDTRTIATPRAVSLSKPC